MKLKTFFAGFATAVVVTGATASNAQSVNTQKLTDHVYAMSALGYTSIVVVGDEDVLISDPANPFRASLLREEIAGLTDLQVGKIVLSHEHFDHTGGTGVFEGAQIIGQEGISAFLDLDPLDMLPDRLDVSYEDALDIDMGTTQVELHHFGAADGVAYTVILLPEEKIASTADLYVDSGLGRGLFLTDTNLLGNRKVLNTLMSWNLNHAINAHSQSTSLEPLIATAGFLNDLYDAMAPELEKTAVENPGGLIGAVLEMSETLEMPAYQDWPNYQDLPAYVQKMGFAITHGG